MAKLSWTPQAILGLECNFFFFFFLSCKFWQKAKSLAKTTPKLWESGFGVGCLWCPPKRSYATLSYWMDWLSRAQTPRTVGGGWALSPRGKEPLSHSRLSHKAAEIRGLKVSNQLIKRKCLLPCLHKHKTLGECKTFCCLIISRCAD